MKTGQQVWDALVEEVSNPAFKDALIAEMKGEIEGLRRRVDELNAVAGRISGAYSTARKTVEALEIENAKLKRQLKRKAA